MGWSSMCDRDTLRSDKETLKNRELLKGDEEGVKFHRQTGKGRPGSVKGGQGGVSTQTPPQCMIARLVQTRHIRHLNFI